MGKLDDKLRREVAKEIKDRQAAAWDRVNKKPYLSITDWADLADFLDAILDDLVEFITPED